MGQLIKAILGNWVCPSNWTSNRCLCRIIDSMFDEELATLGLFFPNTYCWAGFKPTTQKDHLSLVKHHRSKCDVFFWPPETTFQTSTGSAASSAPSASSSSSSSQKPSRASATSSTSSARARWPSSPSSCRPTSTWGSATPARTTRTGLRGKNLSGP